MAWDDYSRKTGDIVEIKEVKSLGQAFTYIENYSLWLDLKIALLTPKILITPDATEGIEDDQITAKKNS